MCTSWWILFEASGKCCGGKFSSWHEKFKHGFWHWNVWQYKFCSADCGTQFNGHREERYIMTGGELFWAINAYNPTLSTFHQGCQGTKSAALRVTWSSTWLWTLLRAVSRHFGGHTRHEIQTLRTQIHFQKAALFIICDSQQLTSPGNKLNSPSAHCYSACVWLPWFGWLEHQFLPSTFPVLFSVGDAAFSSCCLTKKQWSTGMP